MAAVTDDHLTLRATQGDRQAFEAIYQRYHRDLYRFCLAMVGNPHDAQDALQNTMVKVLRALPGEKRHIQLKPWLYRIARNEAVETVRKRRDAVQIEPEQSVAAVEVAETAEMRERLRRLIADLEELPERQRAALVMRELAGLGFAEIGAAFETSAAVARQTVYEARLSLRQMEEGREMSCELVMRDLSDADGRVTRRRQLRAHLRGCASCRAFQGSIAARRGEFAAIAPLPLALSAGILHGVLSGKASVAGIGSSTAGIGGAAGGAGATSGGGVAATIGAGAGKAVATSAILKSAATVAVVAAVGVTAADRGGLIHVPVLDGARPSHTSSPPAPASPATGTARSRGGPASAESTGAAAAGGGTGRAGSPQATPGAGARRNGSGAAASGKGAQRAGSSHAGGRNGGAHGRSHAGHRHGKPSDLPAAAGHGQQTASTHKTATSHRQHSSSGSGSSHASTRRGSHHSGARATPPKPAPHPKEAAVPPPSAPASAEPPLPGGGGETGKPSAGTE